MSVNNNRDEWASRVSETVWVYDNTATKYIIISVFIPELQVFDIMEFFLVHLRTDVNPYMNTRVKVGCNSDQIICYMGKGDNMLAGAYMPIWKLKI
jgi:hypothetical protein